MLVRERFFEFKKSASSWPSRESELTQVRQRQAKLPRMGLRLYQDSHPAAMVNQQISRKFAAKSRSQTASKPEFHWANPDPELNKPACAPDIGTAQPTHKYPVSIKPSIFERMLSPQSLQIKRDCPRRACCSRNCCRWVGDMRSIVFLPGVTRFAGWPWPQR